MKQCKKEKYQQRRIYIVFDRTKDMERDRKTKPRNCSSKHWDRKPYGSTGCCDMNLERDRKMRGIDICQQRRITIVTEGETEKQSPRYCQLVTRTENHMAKPYRMLRYNFEERGREIDNCKQRLEKREKRVGQNKYCIYY